MKDFLKDIWITIRAAYYSVVLILGILGIIQVKETSEPSDVNFVIIIISFLAIGYSIRNAINLSKEK